MIDLLSWLELMMPTTAKKLVLALLLLSFSAYSEVPPLLKKGSNDHYGSIICSAPETAHFPLSTPLSVGEATSGIEDDFSEEDEGEGNTDLSYLSFCLSKFIYSPYLNYSESQEFLNSPFTPPESITPNRIYLIL